MLPRLPTTKLPPGPPAGPAKVGSPTQTIVTTPHPTTAFSHDIDAHIASKLQRNRHHRYDTLQQARGKYERYLAKRLDFLACIRDGSARWGQADYPPALGLSRKAVDRLHAALQADGFAGPTVREEAERCLRQIENTLVTFHAAAADPSQASQDIASAFNRPGTWAGRDNDRSQVVFGDHTALVAAQVQRACAVYETLLDAHGAGPPLQAADTIRELLRQCRHLAARWTAPVAAPEADLQALQDRIRELCAQQPGAPFAATFLKCGLAGFAGEVRINAAGLAADATPAERRRIAEILDEIRLVHSRLRDTGSIVIADFSQLGQVRTLRGLLDRRGLDCEIIPLLESGGDVEAFLADAAGFKAAGVGTVMLAGSDLVRVAGTAQAIVLRHRMNKACAEHGLVPYQGIGTAVRRNGVGLTGDALSREMLPRLFHPAAEGAPQEYRYTVQGGDAAGALANPALARQFFERRMAVLPPAAPMPSAADAAADIFAALTTHELAMRPADSAFAAFYRAHPVIRALRNASVHHGSRDAAKPGLRHLYEDRAINCDASMELFHLAASFAWSGLAAEPGALQRLVDGTRQALAAGNPVVHDIVLNYAIQASTVYFEDLSHEKWQAAGCEPHTVAALQASRAAMLGFLAAVGFDLAGNPALQRHVMEYLGADDTAGEPLAAIRQRRQRCEQAGIAAIRALRERDDAALPDAQRRLAALELHLQLTAAYVLGVGVKS